MAAASWAPPSDSFHSQSQRPMHYACEEIREGHLHRSVHAKSPFLCLMCFWYVCPTERLKYMKWVVTRRH